MTGKSRPNLSDDDVARGGRPSEVAECWRLTQAALGKEHPKALNEDPVRDNASWTGLEDD